MNCSQKLFIVQIAHAYEILFCRIMGDSDHESDDITIPRAAMNKMIKELCPQIRVANEAR